MAKNPQEMSNEELLKTEKSIKILMSITIVSSIVILAIGVYLSIIKAEKINTVLYLILVFALLTFSNYYNLRGIQKEKETRKV